MAMPANQRFLWESEVAIVNLLSLGVSENDIYILLEKEDNSVKPTLKMKFADLNVYEYSRRPNKEALKYQPSIRPYLWYKFLEENPEMQKENFVYQDSDIIYRKLPTKENFPSLSSTHWYGADTEGYTGYDYLNSKGDDVIDNIALELGLTADDMLAMKGQAIGAHWIISCPSAEYFKDVYHTCYQLYDFLEDEEPRYLEYYKTLGKEDENYVQIWCAEMYAQLYLCRKYGITTEKSSFLDFNWSSDKIAVDKQTCNILHNAGITQDIVTENPEVFFKGKEEYVKNNPWSLIEKYPLNFKSDYASAEYAKAVYETGKILKEI